MKTGSSIIQSIFLGILMISIFTSCREDIIVSRSETILIGLPEYTSVDGFYLLNEGGMGTNKATLDYYDYKHGTYTRNIFAEANPSVVQELGDVGNDIQIYGNRLYAVINCSNKIDVMDKRMVTKIGQIEIPNCRYIDFHEGYAYVTSYAGPIQIDPNYKQIGYVAKVDTATLEVIARCLVGYQPDELEIVGNRIYVANSGGYMVPNYENTVSVIDINSFTEIKRIEVARNLHRLQVDEHAHLWVSSRGNYYSQPSKLYKIDLLTETLTDSIDIAVSNFHLDGDSLYICSTEWSNVTNKSDVSYGIVDVRNNEIITRNLITDGTEKNIRSPYGITVNPITKDFYIADGRDYVKPGKLYCFNKYGKKTQEIDTGDIPGHFVFLGELK